MPKLINYVSPNPYESPEPRFVPGYTGYLPGYGPKRLFQMADTYGRMTNAIMAKHPVAGERLTDIPDTSKREKLEETTQYYLSKHKRFAHDLKLRDAMISGYTGFIPQRKFLYGKPYTPECENAVAHFERLQENARSDRQPQKYRIDVNDSHLPVSLPPYPIDQSYFDPRIKYSIKHLLVEKPQKYEGALDTTGGYRSFAEMSLKASNNRIYGEPFSANEFLHGRVAMSARTKPTSNYDCNDDQSQIPRYDMPIPWYMWPKPGSCPAFGKPKNGIAAPTDLVFLPDKMFIEGLRSDQQNLEQRV